MEWNPESLDGSSIYKLLSGVVVPRPIGWISTVDLEGNYNLAPYSFFNLVSANPPYVVFSPARKRDLSLKDTLHNTKVTGEFVVNMVTEELAEKMNLTAADLPSHSSEFELAELTPIPSVKVKPPRVGESPVNLECRLTHMIELSPEPGGCTLVVGRVVYIHISDEILSDGHKIDFLKYKALGRLAGKLYCKTDQIIELERPK